MDSAPLNTPTQPAPTPAAERRDAFIIRPADPTVPLTIDTLFDGQRPLEVDVGCGKGRFLTARAAAHPEANFLGIDRLLLRLRKISKRLLRHGLSNVRLLRLEAAYAVRYLLPPRSVSVFYVFFPDPWPKRRHHRRRLFCPQFLDDLHRTLQPNGRVHVATDHLEYFAAIEACFAADARFDPTEPFQPTADQQTDFEIGFLAAGARIGRASFVKREAQRLSHPVGRTVRARPADRAPINHP